jgi:hypothetical protein
MLIGDNGCPACRAALWAPDAESVGEKTCPRCGAALWVLAGSKGPLYCPRRPGETQRQFLAALAAKVYDTTAEAMEGVLNGADALDVVEVVFEIEQAARAGSL